jgi:hypothetical protein
MRPQALYYTFLIIFAVTAVVTLLGVVGVVAIKDTHLTLLLSAFLIELAVAVVSLFKRTEFFSKEETIVAAPRGATIATRAHGLEAASSLSGPHEQRMDRGRAKAIVGKWEGRRKQEIGRGGRPFDAECALELNLLGNTIRGTARHWGTYLDKDGSPDKGINDGKQVNAEFTVSGGFFLDRFLQLTYEPIDLGIQFGTMILEINADGRRLTGRFLGYGRFTERLVYGTLELTKVA